MAKTKSGIESPAGYNGIKPGTTSAPVKHYPSTTAMGSKSAKVVEGPAKDACYNGKK